MNKRLCEDIYGDDSFPNCPMCDGSGMIWIHRHWYSAGEQVACDYCEGKGKLTWKDNDEENPKAK